MYNAMISEKIMEIFELQTRAATLNHIFWDFLIIVKKHISGFLLLFGDLPLTEFTRLGSSGPFSVLLTHFPGCPACCLSSIHMGFLSVGPLPRAASQHRTGAGHVLHMGGPLFLSSFSLRPSPTFLSQSVPMLLSSRHHTALLQHLLQL